MHRLQGETLSKKRRSKWEWKYEPDEPEPEEFIEPYGLTLPRGAVCHELTDYQSEVADFVNDFESHGLGYSHDQTDEYGFPYRFFGLKRRRSMGTE